MVIVLTTTDATTVESASGMELTGDGWVNRGRREWVGRRTVLKPWTLTECGVELINNLGSALHIALTLTTLTANINPVVHPCRREHIDMKSLTVLSFTAIRWY